MLEREEQKGFTLVEVALVVTIIAAMSVIAFSGRGQSKTRSEYSAALEEITNILAKVRNEANSSVHIGNGDSYIAGVQSVTFYGKLVEFSDGVSFPRSQIRVSTLIVTETPPDSGSKVLSAVEVRLIDIPYRVEFQPVGLSPRMVIFVRGDLNGRLATYTPPLLDPAPAPPASTATGNLAALDLANYARPGWAPSDAGSSFRLVSPDDPSVNGDIIITKDTISRRFN